MIEWTTGELKRKRDGESSSTGCEFHLSHPCQLHSLLKWFNCCPSWRRPFRRCGNKNGQSSVTGVMFLVKPLAIINWAKRNRCREFHLKPDFPPPQLTYRSPPFLLPFGKEAVDPFHGLVRALCSLSFSTIIYL
jgi:hypothetical protein